jgi:hypothetical protein
MTEPTNPQFFTAARIAAALGITPQAARKRLAATQPDGMQVVAGNEAAAWSVAALPAFVRADLEAEARKQSFRNVEAMLAAPRAQWEPAVPLNRICARDQDKACKLRKALLPYLAQQHDATLSSAELERRGVADYFRIMGARISDRYWRKLFMRTLERDAGTENWGRLEIYLPEAPGVKESADRQPAQDSQEDFCRLESFIQACGNPASPSETEQRAIWALATDHYHDFIAKGMEPKRAARRVRQFLFRRASFLAPSRDALLKAFERRLARFEEAGGDVNAFRDRRESNGQPFELPEDDRDLLIHRSVFFYRGDVATAWRDLLKQGFSELVRTRYITDPARKSYVPRNVMESVGAEVEILTVMHQGPRAFDAIRGHVDRSYEGISSLKCMTADDFTMPVYFFVPDGRGWFTLTRGQILIFSDFRSLRILGWSMQPDRNYSSLTIRSLCTHVFAEHGVPSVIQFERGIWESSALIKGRDPAPLEFTEVVQGLREFGIKFIHSIRPRSKTIERIGGLLQDRMEAEPGYCGRNEREDAPECLRKQMAAVSARNAHPSQSFYSFDEWQARFGQIVADYNAAPQGGRILGGLSPDEAFAKNADNENPPMQFSAELRYLLAHDKRTLPVTLNGLTLQVGKQRFNYRGKEIAHLVGQKVLAWFDPENPERLVVTDMQRRNPICVERSSDVSALECVTDPESGRLGRELKRVEDQASYMKARFAAVKAKFPMPQRGVVTDAQTVSLGRQIAEKRAEQQTRAVKVARVRDQARRLDIPAVMVGDDPETCEAIKLMAEAERENRAALDVTPVGDGGTEQ